MRLLNFAQNLLHIGGCVVLLYGVIVTVFVIAGFSDSRPFGLHPIQFGLIFAVAFAVTGTALIAAGITIRKRFLS